MTKKSIAIFSITIAVVFLFTLSVSAAAAQDLSGYIYSPTAGWISLNCSNTSSCVTVEYKVLEDNNGNLSGYGYSEVGSWINFNPNYGGATINSDSQLSGWVFSQTDGWINIDSAKVISSGDLQNEITSTTNTINNNDLSSVSTTSLLNSLYSLCNQFLTASQCSVLTSQ